MPTLDGMVEWWCGVVRRVGHGMHMGVAERATRAVRRGKREEGEQDHTQVVRRKSRRGEKAEGEHHRREETTQVVRRGKEDSHTREVRRREGQRRGTTHVVRQSGGNRRTRRKRKSHTWGVRPRRREEEIPRTW